MKRIGSTAILLLVLVLWACGDSDSGGTGVGKIGEAVKKDGYVITVNGTERVKGLGSSALALDVTIASDKEKGVDAGSIYAKIKDADGKTYTLAAGGKQPSLEGKSDLPKGQSVRGWISFNVPEGTNGLVLEYQALGGPLLKVNLS